MTRRTGASVSIKPSYPFTHATTPLPPILPIRPTLRREGLKQPLRPAQSGN
ncbi:hypothetical protein VTJ04DRAFT_3484 [Mycothermus thermophilus]|uniref:uncharacterized protein n=1 Tax=Humicola insolens TaxID=85995 RepID=UPI0037449357